MSTSPNLLYPSARAKTSFLKGRTDNWKSFCDSDPLLETKNEGEFDNKK